jgi:hypothetical protein
MESVKKPVNKPSANVVGRNSSRLDKCICGTLSQFARDVDRPISVSPSAVLLLRRRAVKGFARDRLALDVCTRLCRDAEFPVHHSARGHGGLRRQPEGSIANYVAQHRQLRRIVSAVVPRLPVRHAHRLAQPLLRGGVGSGRLSPWLSHHLHVPPGSSSSISILPSGGVKEAHILERVLALLSAWWLRCGKDPVPAYSAY